MGDGTAMIVNQPMCFAVQLQNCKTKVFILTVIIC